MRLGSEESWPINIFTYQMLFALCIGGTVVELSGLNDFGVHFFLQIGSSDDMFLNRLRGHQSEDANFLFLTNTMGSILCLEILMRVPWRSRRKPLVLSKRFDRHLQSES